MFGPVDNQAISQVLVRKREDKISGMVSVLRVVGSVLVSDTDDTLPMVFMLGRGPYTATQGGASFHILHREHTKWDEVKNRFDAKLTAKTVSHPDVVQLRTQFEKGIIPEPSADVKDFAFVWRRETLSERTGVLENKPDRSEVLGSLDIYIPYVLFRDEHLCKEVIDALDLIP